MICAVSLSPVRLCDPKEGPEPTKLLCPWGFSRQEYLSELPCPPPGDLPNPGIEPRSPTLQTDSFPSEPPEMRKNIGVGSLSFVQGNLPDPGIKPGSPPCRRILYQLSYQGRLLQLFNINKYFSILLLLLYWVFFAAHCVSVVGSEGLLCCVAGASHFSGFGFCRARSQNSQAS